MLTYDLAPRKNRCGEYVVRAWENGKRRPALDYHTTDHADAVQTLAAMQCQYSKRSIANVGTHTADREYDVTLSHHTGYHSGTHTLRVRSSAGYKTAEYAGITHATVHVSGLGFGCSRDYFVADDKSAIRQFMAEHACKVEAIVDHVERNF